MIDILLGVPGKLKTLVDRLASTRAANLDNLDATISSRAAASTALSNADWTSGRAAKLDNIDALNGAVPKASGLSVPNGGYKHIGVGSQVGLSAAGKLTQVSTVNTTYLTLLSLTGTGTVSFLTVMGPVNTSINHSVRLTVDGVVVFEHTSVGAGDGTYGRGCNVIGGVATDNSANVLAIYHGDPIPYKSSFLVETKTTAASSGPTMYGYYCAKQVT